MSKKFTTQEFIARSIEKHGKDKYDYSFTVYKNTKTKVLIGCLINPKHGTFEQLPNDHVNGHGCRACANEGNRITQEEFIARSIVAHGEDKYDYSAVTYKTGKDKVLIGCLTNIEHGWFKQKPENHMAGSGCAKCAVETAASVNRNTLQDFITKSNSIHGEGKYDYSLVVYKNSHVAVTIICKEHGKFEQTADAHMRGHGCPTCGYKIRAKANTNPAEDFFKKVLLIHGEGRYDYTKFVYVNTDTKGTIGCLKNPKHGFFEQKPHHHLQGKGCPKCSRSVSNKETAWLDSLRLPNDKFHRQVKIEIDNKKYNVDGYDPLTNTVYEFHGDYWHGNLNLYEPDFINKVTGGTMRQLYDQTCKKHRDIKGAGYNLVWIWESDWEKQVAVNKMFAEAA